MLYLPTAIASEALPEAAELVPVTENGRQTGTIIVSVSDEVLSADNPDHVQIANAIETRLADQDLLLPPTHAGPTASRCASRCPRV